MTDTTSPPVGDPWTATSPAQCAARWWAGWLTRPLFTAWEAAALTGRPDDTADDTALVASAVDVGIATVAQVRAFAVILEHELLGTIAPDEVVKVGHGGGPGHTIRRALDGADIDPRKTGLVMPRWMMNVSTDQVLMWPYDGDAVPVVVWPVQDGGAATVAGLVETAAWQPAMRWADDLVGWHRATQQDGDRDPWTGVDDDDQLAVIALIGTAIRQAHRQAHREQWRHNPGDRNQQALIAGFVPQTAIRMQIASPQAVATLLAGPRPPDDLGGRHHDRLSALGREASGIVTLAHTVLADYHRQSQADSGEHPDAAADDTAYLVGFRYLLKAAPPRGVYLTRR